MIEIREFLAEDKKFQAILKRAETCDSQIRDNTEAILKEVHDQGDAALVTFSAKFDKVELTPEQFRVSEQELESAQDNVDQDFLTAIALARVNIRRFHEYQRRSGYVHDDGDGVLLSKRVLPLKRVGVCVPAGSAPLFSSLLMNVIPAQIAGVEEIYVVTPPRKDGTVDPHILTAAKLLGVTAVFRVGGAHAVGALAYGTNTIPKVDKVVGPGGPYVNMAKRLVFGTCGIDSLAGPSEIVVIADKSAPARYVAADLMSQLEHGSGFESGVVFTDSRDMAAAIKIEVERQAANLSRKDAIEKSLKNFGAIFICKDLSEAVWGSNQIAPEHLEIICENGDDLLADVQNAGAVFMGAYSSEPIGDYFAGTNHVLPTAGAARFSSSLSVYDFVKDISVIRYSSQRLARTGRHILHMAEIEGLTAHANAVKVRMDDLGRS